ncbi:nucleotide-binding protein [Microbispora rosea subsp. aerata]|nr:RNase adapter RapZ [Microbispora rosea]GGO24593.1 nucleotide-binding protein [Microbispora rosea subsp. aerata]GIH58062.1 nucleotide-binding protein [Microbispora rosea subsp. aerata]GLJ85610.1 nucleotide-binding protein [Microbispora rosea subsp. aerata]
MSTTEPAFVVITGMSGAGRSTAAKALEDLGWYVIDNLPPGMLSSLAEEAGRANMATDRVAAVVDVRSLAFTTDLNAAIEELDGRGVGVRVVFLEASDEELVRRFENVRRPHPLQGDGRLVDGIDRERGILREVRANADLVIDTSLLNVHELRKKIVSFFGGEDRPGLKVTVVSFGFKYGLPVDADLVVDCRFLPNPHWVPELRALNGLDAPVRDYVLNQAGAKEFLDGYEEVLGIVAAGYTREGKGYATLAVGCTGGKHRSVAMAEELGGRLRERGMDVQVSHRDVGRE